MGWGTHRTSNLLVRSQTPYPLGHDGLRSGEAQFAYINFLFQSVPLFASPRCGCHHPDSHSVCVVRVGVGDCKLAACGHSISLQSGHDEAICGVCHNTASLSVDTQRITSAASSKISFHTSEYARCAVRWIQRREGCKFCAVICAVVAFLIASSALRWLSVSPRLWVYLHPKTVSSCHRALLSAFRARTVWSSGAS